MAARQCHQCHQCHQRCLRRQRCQRGHRRLPPPRLPAIDPRRCTGCGRCVAVCGPHLLSLEVVRWEKSAVLHAAEHCTGCSACAAACPFHAVTMRRPAAGSPP